MDIKNVAASVLVLTAVSGGSYYMGKSSTASQVVNRQGPGQMQGGLRGRFASGAGFVGGTVVALDAQSLTVQLGGPNASSTNNGSTGSKIVLYSDSTQVGKFVVGESADLKVGDSVMVQGSQNADGSVTANSIQIRPAGSPALNVGRERPTTSQ